MKFRILTTVLTLPLLFGLVGCTSARMGQQMERAGEAVEDRMNKMEDAVETFLEPSVSAAGTTAPNAALTREEAEAIALEHAGFAANQVKYLHTEYEIDDGRPQYEVSFHQDRWEYDYEIDAETGRILSFEKDD